MAGESRTSRTLRSSRRWPRSRCKPCAADMATPPRRSCAPLTHTATVEPRGTPFQKNGGGSPGKRWPALLDFRNSIGNYPSSSRSRERCRPRPMQLRRPQPRRHHPPDPLPRSGHPHRDNPSNRRRRPRRPFDATSNFVQLIAGTITPQQPGRSSDRPTPAATTDAMRPSNAHIPDVADTAEALSTTRTSRSWMR